VVGLLVAGALLVKPALGFLGCVAAVVLVVRERRLRDVVVAAAAAATAGLLVSLPFGLGRVWRQTVDYQLESEREQSIVANAVKVLTTLWGRDLLLVVLVVLTLVALYRHVAPSSQRRADDVVVRLLWVWTVLVLAFLVLQPALWRNHLSSLIPPLALLVALRPPPLRWIVIAAIVAVPVHAVMLGGILRPPAYAGPTGAAHEALQRLPDGAWVISDEVGLVWRSHRRTPDDFVDASIKRQQQGQITAETIARAAARPQVCGVLVFSARHWGSFPTLAEELAAVGYRPVERFSGQRGARVLYEKTACRPPQ
jgi:hypothetical protein